MQMKEGDREGERTLGKRGVVGAARRQPESHIWKVVCASDSTARTFFQKFELIVDGKRTHAEVFCEGDYTKSWTVFRGILYYSTAARKEHKVWFYASEITSVICQTTFVCCQSVTVSRQLRGVDGSYGAWGFLTPGLPLVTEMGAAAARIPSMRWKQKQIIQ
ncbi:hypothetical protein Q8A73_014013 [Channa argus]|nr:hypothetical protein Q8A73_014013 [Channa argus]